MMNNLRVVDGIIERIDGVIDDVCEVAFMEMFC